VDSHLFFAESPEGAKGNLEIPELARAAMRTPAAK
jgi:hypothetical protein